MKIETKIIHGGHKIDPSTGAVTPPIHLSTTFEREKDGSYPHEYIYSRVSNPNRAALEDRLCQLEDGAAAAAFSSGSVAAMTFLQALVPQDHIIANDDIYHGVRHILTDIMSAWGLETTFVDLTDPTNLKNAIRPNTKLVMLETPSNPMMKISDIQKIAEIAHQNGAHVLCDNTFATPILQNPFQLGADFILHSTTKYINGHHDTIGGVIITREDNEIFQKVRQIQTVGGAVPSPFECWLTLRGVQTLAIRMPVHCQNAMKVAQFLDSHSAVERVLYPGLPDHPGHDIAAQQMSGFGGMMSFLVKGDLQRSMNVVAKTKIFTRATSLGGLHSLIEHRASNEGADTQTPQNLLRLSVGIENADDLIEDLDQALRG
jgi:cystathionine gamma-synthase